MTLLWCSIKFAQLYKLSLCNKINIQPFLVEGWNIYNWRASEPSETLSGVTNGNRRYIYIYIYMVRARHFCSAGPVLRNVGGVKCEPFLKHSNYW